MNYFQCPSQRVYESPEIMALLLRQAENICQAEKVAVVIPLLVATVAPGWWKALAVPLFFALYRRALNMVGPGGCNAIARLRSDIAANQSGTCRPWPQ